MKLKRLLHPFKFMHRYNNFTTVEINNEWYLTGICKRCGKIYLKKIYPKKESK